MKKLFILMAVVCFSPTFARPYKYYLDPLRAEQVLGSLSFRPRLADEDWLKLINFDKNERRIIQSGDNLWSIARSRFGNPFLWRKLWQENAWLTNPHELEVGRLLAYYREESATHPIKRIPVVKLRPEKTGNISDIDNDIYINRVLKSRYRISYMALGFDEFLGEVTGAYTEKSQIHLLDDLYVSFFEGKKVEPGSQFAVVREIQDLRDQTQPGEPVVGKLVRIVAEIKTLASEGDLSRVELMTQFFPVLRGDKLILIPKVTGNTNAEFPSRDLIPQIIMGEDLERGLLRQGELVVLNKGLNQGMKEGYLFKVFDDTDPLKNRTDGVIPNSKGEVRVVFVGQEYSVGFVHRNREPLKIGDSLVSFPELPDRPAVPKKIRQEVSID